LNFDLTASVTYDILGASWTCDQKVVSDRSIIKLERGGGGGINREPRAHTRGNQGGDKGRRGRRKEGGKAISKDD
jgi:hypothetical protein